MLLLSLESFDFPDGKPMVINKEKIVSRPLEVVPGKYQINIQVLTRKPLTMVLSSSPLITTTLRNGSNSLIYDITKTVPVTITISSSDSDYQLLEISATLLLHRRQPPPLIKPLMPILQRVLPPIREKRRMTGHTTNEGKQNILLVIDSEGWCFDNICKRVMENAGHLYNFTLVASTKRPNYQTIPSPQMIVKFWYGYDHVDPFDVFPDAIRVVCIYDAHHWNHRIGDPSGSSIYGRFLENIRKAQIIGYSCEMIRSLLIEDYPNLVQGKDLVEICDGVDEKLFFQQAYRPETGGKLIVGWVGNTLNPVKRFRELKARLEQEDWIELVTQEKTKPKPLDQMPSFYQSIDVLVCSSLTEGTPNPILEASSSGRAWVSTRVGIVEALNRKRQCGIIVDDLDQIVPALQRLRQDQELMKQMGNNGRISVARNFSWSRRLVAFHNLFARISKGDQVHKIPLSEDDLETPVVQQPLQDHVVAMSDPVEICWTGRESALPGMSRTSAKRLGGVLDKIKFMVTSTQYPRYGGAATCAYEMHRYLLSLGLNSVCIFFDNSVRDKPELYNPDGLINVHQHKLAGGSDKVGKISYDALIGSQPDKIFAFNYLAPIISKHIFPSAKVYYMVTGCGYINNNNLISVEALLGSPFPLESKSSDEKVAIRVSDKVIPNTILMKNLLEHCYRIKVEDPIDLHEIFHLDSAQTRVGADREFDMVFISSDLSRKVKNPALLKEIYHSPELRHYKKLVIGKNSEALIGSNPSIGLQCLDFMGQEEILKILSKSKIVIICSLIESYSIVAVEASQMGCIVLASKNAACSSMMNQFFVIDDYRLDSWRSRIELILSNYAYYQSIYSTRFFDTSPITSLLADPINTVRKIIFVSVDIPYIGGCATNTYRMIKALRELSQRGHSIHGIFISNQEGEVNPDGLPNIHRVPYGRETRQKLIECRRIIEAADTIDHISYIFLKNYKLYPFVQSVFGDVRVIFSPSGFRSVSSSDHHSAGYLESKSVINMTNIQDPHQFILDNDRYLDDYAIKNADLVMPNSRLSHQFIDESLPKMPTLRSALYITNVCYEPEKVPKDAFAEREYDLIFCSYDWKRSCKGYPLVTKIITDPSMARKKILIIGKTQRLQGAALPSNTTSLSYLPNDEVLNYLRRSKVLVIPSVYDSNPNILVEAVLSGCNVVTNRRVGNHENLDPRSIVEEYGNLEGWLNAIILSLPERFIYHGPSRQKIVQSLEDLFDWNASTRSATAVYKIPPEFNTVQKCSQIGNLSSFDFRAARDDEIAFARNIVDHDIYFQLFYGMAVQNHCGNINYLVYDQSIDNNIYVNLSKLDPNYPSGAAIWKIKDIQSFSRFTRSSFYFLRGTYYEFFRKLVPDGAFTVFYPATSLKQEMPGKTSLPMPAPLTNQVFDIVLHHEDPRYRLLYKGRSYHLFNKFASDIFTCHSLHRDIDICFVATEKQPTKNHDLFFGMIEYFEQEARSVSIVYIGDLSASMTRYAPSFKLDSLVHVKLISFDSLPPMEMVKIYNRSRINISFSGRDAFPRVTGESAACGCFNVAFDTLSDSKNFYDEPLGRLISVPTVRIIRKPGASLSYINSPVLWEEVKKELDRVYDHNYISRIYKNKHSLTDFLRSLPGL